MEVPAVVEVARGANTAFNWLLLELLNVLQKKKIHKYLLLQAGT